MLRKCIYWEKDFTRKFGIQYPAVVLFDTAVCWDTAFPTGRNELLWGLGSRWELRHCHTPLKTTAAGDYISLRKEGPGGPRRLENDVSFSQASKGIQVGGLHFLGQGSLRPRRKILPGHPPNFTLSNFLSISSLYPGSQYT